MVIGTGVALVVLGAIPAAADDSVCVKSSGTTVACVDY